MEVPVDWRNVGWVYEITALCKNISVFGTEKLI
jgi:hypothetical protein